MMQLYKTPPITEAVIEIRFNGSIDQEKLGKVAKRLEKRYPLQDEENVFQVEINGPNANLNVSPFGFKGTSVDQADVILWRPSHLGLSRRAPYLGWDEFQGRFIDAWQGLKDVVGSLQPTRVGVRYLNRIDVPGTLIEPSHYLWLFPQTPSGFPQSSAVQAAHLVTRMADHKCEIIINVSTVASPLVGHAGLQLDIDVARVEELPGRVEDLKSVLAAMRSVKNEMFEMLVTDKARGLFG